jgi:hypothetical protein
MSINDIPGTLSEGFGYLTDNGIISHDLLDRAQGSLENSINQGMREATAYFGNGLGRVQSGVNDAVSQGVNQVSSEVSRRAAAAGIPVGIDELQEAVVRRVYDGVSGSLEQKETRGGFIRNIQEIIGGNGLTAARDITQDLSGILESVGLPSYEGMTIKDGVDTIKQGLENLRGSSTSSAGVLDKVQSGLQIASDAIRTPNFSEISDIISNSSEGSRELRDNDGDGDIDSQDLAISQHGDRLITELRLLHPLIQKAHRNPNFMQRKIGHKKIDNENIHNQQNQVNLVQQGIASHIQDVNLFQVSY